MVVENLGKDESKKLKRICKMCGTILSFYRIDIKSKKLSYQGDVEFINYIECVECKHHITIKENL